MKTQMDITNGLIKDIISYIANEGGKAVRINVTPVKGRRPTNTGYPDIDAVYKGIGFKVEVKKDEKDKLRESQIAFISDWERAEGKVIVTWELEHFIDNFNKLKQGDL